jgi:allantoinase
MRRLRRALRHCLEHSDADKVWWTRPRDIADFCYELPKGVIPGS